jgi:GT2 family glycosyltransferase
VPMPTVYIIVVNWNGKSDTLQCLASLEELDYHPFRIVIVDNDSADGSVSSIRAHYPDTTIIETGENLGYTGGNNVGIRHALDCGADYVFLLNNDTIVDPQMLEKLVDFAESHPLAGIVGPKQYFFDQPNAIAGTGSVIDWRHATIWHLRRGEVESEKGQSVSQVPRKVDFMDGCAVCVRREFIEKVGMLDERFHLGGYEDADWGTRAAAHGYQVWNMPEARMWHKISAAAGIGSPLTTYYMTRNALLFFWQNAPGYRRWLCASRIVLRTVRTIGAWTLKSKYRTETFRRKRDANLLALRDFFLGRFGRMGPDVAKICGAD